MQSSLICRPKHRERLSPTLLSSDSLCYIPTCTRTLFCVVCSKRQNSVVGFGREKQCVRLECESWRCHRAHVSHLWCWAQNDCIQTSEKPWHNRLQKFIFASGRDVSRLHLAMIQIRICVVFCQWYSKPHGGSNLLNVDFALYDNIADAQVSCNMQHATCNLQLITCNSVLVVSAHQNLYAAACSVG